MAAAARLQSYQSKLPAFPLHLPARVVAPCALAYDAPGPNARIAGYTMPLVRDFADWWNCPGYALARLNELRALAGDARISAQHPIGLAANDDARDDAIATVQKRFGTWGGVIAGTAAEVRDAIQREIDDGVEGFVCQFGDFGTGDTIDRFMTEVAAKLRA